LPCALGVLWFGSFLLQDIVKRSGGTEFEIIDREHVAYLHSIFSVPRAICNITAPLEDAFVDCLGGCLVSLRRKSEVGLGGQEEEGFVLRSLKSLAELLDLSAFPFCGGVVTAFLALSRSRLFSSMLFAA